MDVQPPVHIKKAPIFWGAFWTSDFPYCNADAGEVKVVTVRFVHVHLLDLLSSLYPWMAYSLAASEASSDAPP